MDNKKFKDVAVTKENENYSKFIHRENSLYSLADEIRSPFARDYTRILHCTAYRRLKHKTQVFYNIENDHICTRMEHVSHVESVSYTIADNLGLNTELTKAIATAHDLGHAPFGHNGEKIIDEISRRELNESFWHEKNGLYFVDKIELLPDYDNIERNLNLTYAVRDGIISHCGEVSENGIKPRKELINLDLFEKPNQYDPATFEACVVKLSDNIAYVGRDIEDALSLGFIDEDGLKILANIAKVKDAVNTTVIMRDMITDVCANSSPQKGICLSEERLLELKRIKKFNYEYIYGNKRFEVFNKYAKLILNELFNVLADCWNNGDFESDLLKMNKFCPVMIKSFTGYLKKYSTWDGLKIYSEDTVKTNNIKVYGNLDKRELYIRGVIDYIAGMTDRYAVTLFNELITY